MKHVSETEFTFNETYKDLWPQVYKFVYYKVQNEEEAEELTQEVFQRVFKHIRKNAIDKEKIKSYIFTSARNIIYDLWRKRKNNPKLIMLEDLKDNGFEVSDGELVIEDNLVVKEVLNQLSTIERKVLVMRIVEGYQINEVSEMLGKPIGTIKSLQYRAIHKLRDKLEKGGYFIG